MNNAIEFDALDQVANIKVIGVGGAGCNAVNRMVEDGVQGVEFWVANSDAQVLMNSKVKNRIHLGQELTKGLGAGANPNIGREATEESENEIRDALKGADMVFVAAGMGGGTGTGGAPIVAKIAKESNALVVGIVTRPFKFEGRVRWANADAGLEEIKEFVDSLIIVSNDKVMEVIGGIPMRDAFREADKVLRQGVQTITDLIAVPAIINLDFADVRTTLTGKGCALIGIGLGAGESKAEEAAMKAITSPLLDASINGSKNAIVNITGGEQISLLDAHAAVEIIRNAAGEDINILFGVAVNENLGDEMIVTVIATDFDGDELKEAKKVQPTKSISKEQVKVNYQKYNSRMSEQELINQKVKNHSLTKPNQDDKITYQSDLGAQKSEPFSPNSIFDDTEDIPLFLKNK